MNLGALRKHLVVLPWVEAKLNAKGFSSEGVLGSKGKQAEVEKLWQELFSKPTKWRDHRLDKINPSFPDFIHKERPHKALWLDSKWIPPWVESKLAATAPLVFLSTFSPEHQGELGSGGKKAEVKKLWEELFSNPTAWRDHRSDKINPSFPDFSHKERPHKALWLVSKWTPPWVEPKLAALPPDIVQLGTFSWNQRLSRYAQARQYEKIVELFQQMQLEGENPDRFTFFPVLKACANLGQLELGRQVQAMMPPGLETDIRIGTTLVDMYAKCGSIEEAERVFKQMPTRDVVTVSAMICGYAKCGQGQKALELFEQMRGQGLDPNLVTFVGVLNACASIAGLEIGRRVHEDIIRRGYEADIVVATCLVDMYAKCGSIEEAERVFKQMPTRNVVTLSAMICGYAKCGQGQKALELFEQMRGQGLDPNPVTFVGVLNACASIAALEIGRRVHEDIIRRGYEADIVVATCLVDMYAKCGSIEEAERVFKQMPTRNVITLSAMICGYAKCGQGQKALELFEQMRGQGLDPDPVTFVGVLNACASIAALELGRRVHEEIICRGYEVDIVVATSLIDMYSKCKSIEEAERVFKQMPTRDVVTLSAMIGGYAKCGEGHKALELFEQMRGQGLDPDPVTFVGVLNACSSIAALEMGRHAHEEIIRRGHDVDIVVGTCLVDMYAKCGSIEEAERVFKLMPTRNVVAWNALLAGYGINGYAITALETFTEMCKVVEIDSVTFICLLSACSHGGLVSEGLEYFKSMTTVYNITPTVEHYACVVDLLGRAGHLGEAEDLIMRMPIDPNATVWMALLSACSAHVNVQLGEHCVRRLLELDPDNAAAYVVLSNIYTTAGMWDSSARLNAERLYRGVRKIPGRTWIEVNSQVHSFIVDDDAHPQIENILKELEKLSSRMKDAGYDPDTGFVLDTTGLQCVNKEEKEFHTCYHSEKLAVAFGLISTAHGTPLRIVKNLQVCSDCHAATKFIAKIVGRAITVRDANQFHHFQGGLCSCKDY